MTNSMAKPDRRVLSRAWAQLHTAGTASKPVANLMKIGLEPFLEAFAQHLLGPDGLGEGLKLVLGMNGEGKTHLLLCLRELALQNGHAVSFIDAKSCGTLDSPMDFARAVLRAIETPEALTHDSEDLRLAWLLESAVARKRAAIKEKGLDPDLVLQAWAESFRGRDLHPFGLGAALAKGLLAAARADKEELRTAVGEITADNQRMPKKQADTDGTLLMRSIPRVITQLEFQPLVVLLDEAETAVEKKGSAKRREFLKFLRFLNDHVAHSGTNQVGSVVVIGCTDDFWPEQFNDYTALKDRLSDPGRDRLEDRASMTPKARARANKLWVRETFGGSESDYEALGAALVELAAELYPDVNREIQLANAHRMAKVASSSRVRRQVKRYFVKALTHTIEQQVSGDDQRVLEERQAQELMDAAPAEILAVDQES